MGIEWTFSYGSDYLFLDFAKFVNVFLGVLPIFLATGTVAG